LQRFLLAKRAWVVLFGAVCAAYFYGLGAVPLMGPDEPRYAQVAREMFARGDWVTPTLGGHTWFEKPALLYWLMEAAYGLFGVTEFAARLGSALCGALTVLLAGWAAGLARGALPGLPATARGDRPRVGRRGQFAQHRFGRPAARLAPPSPQSTVSLERLTPMVMPAESAR
jgi:hypothetical protein